MQTYAFYIGVGGSCDYAHEEIANENIVIMLKQSSFEQKNK